MNFLFRSSLFVLGFLSFCSISSAGESSTCLTVYKEGGAPAVFQSPKCPRWKLPNQDFRQRTTADAISRCQSAVLQGRRKSQEDRTLCALDLLIPFPIKMGVKRVPVGVVAVFDGHNGAEASEMASRLLLEYFALHTYFLLDSTYSVFFKKSKGTLQDVDKQDIVFEVLDWNEKLGGHELNFERFKFSIPENLDDSFHLVILKESLLRALHDVDATFSKEALRNKFDSGSTATVILIADDQILVANIGDSKAFLCSEHFQSPPEARATLVRLNREQRRNGLISHEKNYGSKSIDENGLSRYIVKELTSDHHPDREDERSRVEAAGGHVLEWGGVPRVNGQLAVSRAIGNIPYKRYGVIAAPEMTDWQSLTTNDSYLVVASDGVFEKLSLQDACDLLWEVNVYGTVRTELSSSCSISLADCLVKAAFEKGSMDNIAAVVVPLGSSYISRSSFGESFVIEGDCDIQTDGRETFMYEVSGNKMSSVPLKAENKHPLMINLDRILVEGGHESNSCFYLFEKLNDDMSDTVQMQKHYVEDDTLDQPQALANSLEQHYGGSVNLYIDKNTCLQFQRTIGGANHQCPNPETFFSFLGLLESIPFHDTASSTGSDNNATPDMRYVLKKRFGHGSYGEVWLAFNWHCQQSSNASKWSEEDKNTSSSGIHFDVCGGSCNSTFSQDQHASPPEELFVLKRIKVERGASVYLSGLREKYFGELFSNESRSLDRLMSSRLSGSLFQAAQSDLYNVEKNEASVPESENEPVNMFMKKNENPQAAYDEGLNHIVRYVESFESRSNEIWLVFHHEGVSLSKLLYTVEEAKDRAEKENVEEVTRSQVLHPSKWWHWLRTTKEGQEEMCNIIWQLLMALKSCHDRNITHRDIKPDNIVICFEDHETGKCMRPPMDKNFTTRIRIIDFGSAIDEFTLGHLYGSSGPSRSEQTFDYSPPEALLNASWHKGPPSYTSKYDIWSVGVVMLEMILGSPNVFQISSLTRALLDRHIEGWSPSLKELAYKLRSFMELCILLQGSPSKKHNSSKQGGFSPASWKCSEEFFSNQIKSRDPLKLGFPNVSALRFVRHLLLWDPDDRPSVDEALQHSYFHAPPKS